MNVMRNRIVFNGPEYNWSLSVGRLCRIVVECYATYSDGITFCCIYGSTPFQNDSGSGHVLLYSLFVKIHNAHCIWCLPLIIFAFSAAQLVRREVVSCNTQLRITSNKNSWWFNWFLYTPFPESYSICANGSWKNVAKESALYGAPSSFSSRRHRCLPWRLVYSCVLLLVKNHCCQVSVSRVKFWFLPSACVLNVHQNFL